jgi:uncharacterized membrane protein
MNLTLRLRAIWDDLQSSLWYRPAIYTLIALVLALITPYIDQLTTWQFYNIGADNARAVLSSIASSMLTVVTLTFSILMVSFTLASQQFSPRILRTFTRDRASQHVMGLQIGTFLYSLLVMVRVNEVGDTIFVPLLSVLGAIGFSMVGIGAFIYFVDHISRSIRVNYIIANIGEQTVALLHGEMPEQVAAYARQEDREFALQRETAATLTAPSAGYLQGVDVERLVKIAQEHDLLLEMACRTGDFIPRGRPLLQIHPADNVDDALCEELQNQFDLGTERTMFEDVLFGIRQLVDIALKALSPAVNDPTTAMNCLDHLTNILVQAAHRPHQPVHRCDETGEVRLLVQTVTFAAMVELAFHQIRHYGAGDALVVARMIDALTEIAAATAETERRTVLWRYVLMVRRSADNGLTDPQDRRQVNECLSAAARQMGYPVADLLLDRAEDDTRTWVHETAAVTEEPPSGLQQF